MPVLQFNRGVPSLAGLYLALMRDPTRYGMPRHCYAILHWSGPGSAISDAQRWGHPTSGRQIGAEEVKSWLGPLPEATIDAPEPFARVWDPSCDVQAPPEAPKRARRPFSG